MKKYFFLGLLIFFVIFILNIVTFFTDDIRVGNSITQKWEKYYSLDDWNMPSHAVADFDGDGKMDEVPFSLCAYISSANLDTIPKERRCSQPEYIINPAINKESGGQMMFYTTKKNPFSFLQGHVRKSFIVKTKEGKWKAYIYGRFLLDINELGKDGLFHMSSLSFLDYIDYLYYQTTHILAIDGLDLFFNIQYAASKPK